jgi:hypothetical protein
MTRSVISRSTIMRSKCSCTIRRCALGKPSEVGKNLLPPVVGHYQRGSPSAGDAALGNARESYLSWGDVGVDARRRRSGWLAVACDRPGRRPRRGRCRRRHRDDSPHGEPITSAWSRRCSARRSDWRWTRRRSAPGSLLPAMSRHGRPRSPVVCSSSPATRATERMLPLTVRPEQPSGQADPARTDHANGEAQPAEPSPHELSSHQRAARGRPGIALGQAACAEAGVQPAIGRRLRPDLIRRGGRVRDRGAGGTR